MKRNYTFIPLLLLLIVAIVACSNNSSKSAADNDSEGDATKATVQVPQFSADSAYQYIQTQADFGPRVPNTAAHKACGEFLAKKLEEFGAKVYNQHADLVAYDNTILKARNVIGAYNPESKRRVLLCAHWDSRPWADNDPDSTNWRKPVMGANDGASGVAVMLEIARQLQADKKLNPNIGVDFVCFDTEDWGTPQWADVQDDGDTWALGAQYWSENKPEGYNPRFGILLDMVGGQGAKFYREGMSMQYAGGIVKKVWAAARQAGFGSYFPKSDGGMITDDHIPVNEKAKIPTVDVIAYYPDCQQSSFGPTWHTVSDDMAHLDKNVLKAVGQTVIQVLYTEE